MAQHGKKYIDAAKRFDRETLHSPGEALELVKSLAPAKFDETVEMAVRLGVDPRKADQMVRGTVSLPAGTGKDVRVAVFAAGDAARRPATPAPTVGADDLAAQVERRHARLRRGHRHARPDAAGRPARSGARPARPDAEPQDRHGHQRRGQGRQRVQGRQGRVPHRPLRQRPRAARQGQLRPRRPGRQLPGRASTSSSGPSRRRPRAATSADLALSSTMGPGIKVDPTACGPPTHRAPRSESSRPPAEYDRPALWIARPLAADSLPLASKSPTEPVLAETSGPLGSERAPGPPDEANLCHSRGVRVCGRPLSLSGTRPRRARVEVRWRTRDRRRSRWSTRCAGGSTPPTAALLTEYRGLNVADIADLRRALATPAATTRSTRTRWCASPPATSASRSRTCSRARRPSRSSTAIAVPWPRRCGTSPAPTRTWSSRAACSATSVLRPTRPALADVAPRDVLLARLAGAWRRRCSSSPACSQALPRNFAYGLKALIDSRAARPEPRRRPSRARGRAGRHPGRAGGGRRRGRAGRGPGHRDH